MTLRLEELKHAKAIEVLNGEFDADVKKIISDLTARGFLQSGLTGRRLKEAHVKRAEKIIDNAIELRRASIQKTPELATESNFAKFLEDLERRAEILCGAIPQHTARYTRGAGSIVPPGEEQEFAHEAMKVKAHARREIEIMKNELELEVVKDLRRGEQTASSRESRLTVFLCHSSGDKPEVYNYYKKLLNDGYRPWLDEADILPGQDWDSEIRKAVRSSHMVIVFLSHSSITKEGYIQKEIKLVLDVADEKPDGRIFVIPGRLEECTLPDGFQHLQRVDLFKPGGYDKLLEALKYGASQLRGPGDPLGPLGPGRRPDHSNPSSGSFVVPELPAAEPVSIEREANLFLANGGYLGNVIPVEAGTVEGVAVINDAKKMNTVAYNTTAALSFEHNSGNRFQIPRGTWLEWTGEYFSDRTSVSISSIPNENRNATILPCCITAEETSMP